MFKGLTVEVRVGRKRTIVIPKAVAEALGIEEGSRVILEVEGDHAILRPVPDAVTLSLKGRKIARVTLEELEATSLEEQEKRMGEA
jgi:antitoxin MazE